jgi:hypothetical protein
MSTQKELTNLGQSRAAFHAVVIHCDIPSRCRPARRPARLEKLQTVPLAGADDQPLPFNRRDECRPCRMNSGLAGRRAWQGIAPPCTGARDDPGSASRGAAPRFNCCVRWTNASDSIERHGTDLSRIRKGQKRWNKNTTECQGGAS